MRHSPASSGGAFDRRFFLKSAAFLPTLLAAKNSGDADGDFLSKKEIFSILTHTQSLIFPKIIDLNINAANYLKLILSHSKIPKKDKDFLINGAIYLNELSLKSYKKPFLDLEKSDQIALLKSAESSTNWAKSWLNDMLIFSAEAVFGDPIYGANIDEAGWKWISHEAGQPQPKKPFL